MSQRDEVAGAARALADEGLLIGTSGNVSVRYGDLVAVTGAGVVLGAASAADVVVVGLDGSFVEGSLSPTSELDLHLGVYAARPDVAAIVHTHAPFSTAVACVLDELPVLHYQHLLLGGATRIAPYATFGTPELAGHVLAALEGRQAALMASHGSVAVGASLQQAVEHAVLLEWLCALHHRASALGPVRPLTEDEQTAVVLAALERNYGEPVTARPSTTPDNPEEN
jgi:L-fuculose-phosphate aldolase